LNDETICESDLYLACNSPRTDSDICKLLISKGINLHRKRQGISVFELLVKNLFLNNKVMLYRNALIQELYKTFSYTDYKRVIESIDDEQVILVESNHLKALRLLSKDENELEKEIEYFKSMEVRERLIVDYLNVLNDQKELLETRKFKLTESVPDLRDFYAKIKHIASQSAHFKLNELTSEDSFEHLIDSLRMQPTSKLQAIEFSNVIKSINKYILNIKEKIKIGHDFLHFLENKDFNL